MRRSCFYYLLSRTWAGFVIFKNRMGAFFDGSILFGAVRYFWNKVKISFGHCFFMRLADAWPPPDFFDSGKVPFYLMARRKIYEKRMICFSGTSKVSYLSKELKKEFYAAPVKIGGIILVLSILVNIVLSVISKKEISMLNWIMLGLALLIGLGGFFCEADWETIRKSSVIFNKIFK